MLYHFIFCLILIKLNYEFALRRRGGTRNYIDYNKTLSFL